ncbi:ATP-binding protein [Salinisphaera sp. Q1T1-3]|uniref:ATP-binding protein n=1 Tax=Salinisphaera sp. Q1T1-3 TaxID=2321229 RepID=UPI000E7480C0|nr:ATP-binding protein [Salinisphaera sp. Q1T1-3]RJS93496.1 sensor histidine kinase [Salinisphaera sp. Q1T1-3]
MRYSHDGAGHEAGFSLQPASVIRLLARLRTLAAVLLVVAIAAMWVAGFATGVAVWSLPVALLVFNRWLKSVRGRRPAGRALVWHLLFDTLVLFAFFWLIGGATNPFVSLFLLPVAFAGAALDLRRAAAVTLWSIICYTVLLWRYLARVADSTAVMGFERHVIGMWAMFVLAALLLCGFLLALAMQVRERERELAETRERALRDDTLVSVATVAAGAAHALNTPLSTIVVAAESVMEHPRLPADVREDVVAIREQADVAAGELRALVAARDPAAQTTTDIARFLDGVLARWHTRRPEIELDTQAWSPLAASAVRHDPALAQALHNLLDNAADAARAAARPRLQLGRREQHRHIELTIDDPGPAAAERLSRAEQPSTKPDGLGLGLPLARASLARLGASLVFEATPDGGTRTRIVVPLAALASKTR